MSAHQALLLEHVFKKKNTFFRKGIGKWQKSLAEDAAEARSTERLRKKSKRPAADFEQMGVNTNMLFSSRSPLTLLPGKRERIYTREKITPYLSCLFYFFPSKSLNRKLWGGRTLTTTLANSQ